MITASGMIIRTGLDEIRSIGRNTQGVRLIKLKPGDKLVAAEKIIAEDENSGKNDSGDDKGPQAIPKDAPTPEAKDKDSEDSPETK